MKIELTHTERAELLEMKRHSRLWRERERASALLLLDRLGSSHETAAQLGISERTVRRCCKRWRDGGVDGLVEGHRSGRKSRLSSEQIDWLCEEAERMPQTAGQLREALKARFPDAPPVSMDTVKRTLRRNDFRYKRTRYGLKKKRSEREFQAAKQRLSDYRTLAEAGDVDLAYFDESGFSVNPPLRSGWSRRGSQPAVTPQSHRKQLSVIGLQTHHDEFAWSAHWERVTSAEVIGFLDRIAKGLVRPLVVVLDNAPVHRSKAVKSKQGEWQEKGLTLEFLPPYSPELNRIEILWKKLKHFWMPFTDMTYGTLEDVLCRLLNEQGRHLDINYV